MPSALLVSGAGHWADPWHPYPATSARLAGLLDAAGLEVSVREDVTDALVGLTGTGPDLLVLNIGNNDGPGPEDLDDSPGPTLPELEAVVAGLQAHLGRGRPVLAVHSSTTPMEPLTGWSRALGGHWRRGRTMHPPLDEAEVRVRTDAHPVTAGLADFTVTDERYSWLHVEDDVTVLAEHDHAGERHPLLWVREEGPARVVYDALGHDERSYDSPGHQQLLSQALGWLLP